MTIKELLKNKMTNKELELVPSSFDIIGNKDKAVAIIELDERIRRRAKTIANAIMKKHRNVKTVLMKASPRKGEFRTRDYKTIKGLKNTEVMHIENGCKLLVDPTTSYFSSREGTERDRITKKVKTGETVMVFFAGIGPFAVEIAKKAKPTKVIGIEINPVAVDYFIKNIKLNKLDNVEILFGDVVEKSSNFYGKCDRVLMPLPERAIDYLTDAIKCLKRGGMCHLYFFSDENKTGMIKKRIRNISAGINKKIKFLELQRVLPYGPRIWKYRVDFQVTN